jgi:DNA repair protein RadC
MDAYTVLMPSWDKEQIGFVEEFKVMLLSASGRALGICTLFTGGTTGVLTQPKLIFACALKGRADCIIIAHNHPSGRLVPSREDVGLTKRIQSIGKLMEIAVADHLIVTEEGFYSFENEMAVSCAGIL